MKIGLIGLNTASGLGEKNRQLAKYIKPHKWLIVQHRVYKTLPVPDDVDCQEIRFGPKSGLESLDKINDFLDSVDVVLFDETPYYSELPRRAKGKGKRVVCILCLEWTPERKHGIWLDYVDLFICPTRQSFNLYRDELPCVYYPWPVDVDKFEFKQRTHCGRFLFINGHGGWAGRKGASVIRRALELWPEMPLTVRTQVPLHWAVGENLVVLGEIEDNTKLYDDGDVLICPHSVDGTGLEPMEAMASGMPVISTNGQPWNEYPAIRRIPANMTIKRVARNVAWYLPSAESLVGICKGILGLDITQDSLSARWWAEQRAWCRHAESIRELILYGKPEKSKAAKVSLVKGLTKADRRS